MLDKAYNKISNIYNKNLSGKIYSSSAEASIAQIIKHIIPTDRKYIVIDLGMGNGEFLSKLNKVYLNATLNGIDVSAKMIEKAKENNKGLTAYQTTLNNATKYFTSSSMSLVTAHFLSAYTGVESIFNSAKYLLADNGVLSFAAMPQDSFSATYQQLRDIKYSFNPYKFVSSNLALNALKKLRTPKDIDDIARTANKTGFSVIDRQRIEFKFKFNDVDDMYDLMINGSWFINGANIALNFFLQEALCKHVARQVFKLPFTDKGVVEIVLLRLNKVQN